MKRRGFLKSLFAGSSAAALFSAGGARAATAKIRRCWMET